MKKLATLRILTAAVLLSCALAGQGAPNAALNPADPLPLAPDVKVGKLDNGLTYYIKKNGRPEKKLELRLVVKAGSILEDDDQRGLAHFTEHMAFNGSTHFKRNELISYLQSIGVKFGADLNAYTSFNETVYMLPIPTYKKEHVEQGFQVLEDWAHGLSLNEAEINSERGIVLEELRVGKGYNDRMGQKVYPKLFNNSRYADRLPIGKEETLKSFKPEAVKRFYKDWYRPDLMAVIAVGDIEPAEAEALIRKHFGKIKGPAKPRARTYPEIPARAASEALVLRDKEAPSNMVFIRYPIEPSKEGSTIASYRERLVEGLYTSMLALRLAELTQRADPPFIQGGSQRAAVAPGYKSFQSLATLGPGGAQPAVQALVQETERARQFGFTAAELDRTKKNAMRNLENAYKERDKSDSSAYIGAMQRHFLEATPMPGIDAEYAYAKELVPAITLDEVNAAVRKALPHERHKLVVYMGTDRTEVRAPGEDELLASVNAAEAAPVTALEEKTYGASLMETPPRAGSIVKESSNAKLGTTELTFSNGVKAVLKPTDFKNDQILVGGYRPGGQSLYDAKDAFAARMASSIVSQMGVMDYAPLELGKVLAGKSVSAGAGMNELSEGFAGSATNADLETMLQLAYLRFTKPRKDEVLFNSYVTRQRELARSNRATPEALYNDKVLGLLYNDNPLVARLPKPEDYDGLKLDRVAQIYQERIGSAKDFTFFVVGSFEVEKIKPLLATYLGGLPTPAIPTAFRDRGVRPVTGVVKSEVYKGAEQKSRVALVFTSEAKYSEDEAMRVRALVEVLNIKVNEVLREKLGLIYSGGFNGSMSKHPYGSVSVATTLPCAPENVPKVIAATLDLLKQMQEQGPDAADLAKVKENWSVSYRRALRENGYWLNNLQGALANGTDPAIILRQDERAAAITPAELQAVAKRYIKFDNYVQVVLYPETR